MQPELLKEIDKRLDHYGEAGRSTIIDRLLERHFDLMERGRRDLRRLLNDKEMGLILDSLNGIGFFDSVAIYHVDMEVIDAIEMDHLDQKWEVDGKALIDKLNALTDAQKIALVDAVATWWNRVAKGEQPEYGEALK